MVRGVGRRGKGGEGAFVYCMVKTGNGSIFIKKIDKVVEQPHFYVVSRLVYVSFLFVTDL